MSEPKRVTIVTIGQTGAGKSSFGNGYLQIPAFETSSSPDSCTFVTSAKDNQVNNILRTYIDTQGIDDTQGLDDVHVTQMVEFLRSWDYGINAIGIVINGQSPRLDAGTQKLLKLIHVLFNNNNIWNSVFLVFTKWYEGIMTEEDKESKHLYVDKVRDIAKKCIGDSNANPQIPCFFVDAKNDINKFDNDTKDEFISINGFACGKNPIDSKDFQIPDVHYFKIIPEIEKNKLISEEISEDKMKRTRIYADRERQKLISYDETESYSDWVNKETRTIIDEMDIREEFQYRVKISENRTEKFRPTTGSGFSINLVIVTITKEASTKQVHDYYEVTTTYQDMKRKVITDFDKNVSYGDWEIIRTYNEITKE